MKDRRDLLGVSELRLQFGSGYRIYFGEVDNKIIILLCADTKVAQSRDIEKAKEYWQEVTKRTKKMSKSILDSAASYQDNLIEALKDVQETEAYLKVALEEYEDDKDPEAFLLALRNVAEAQGGLTKLARITHLNHFYFGLIDLRKH